MRGLLRAGGVFLTLGALVLVGRSWSDTKTKAPAPRTRVALVNLNYVVKNYDKYKTFQAELKKALEPYQQRDADKKKEAEALADEAKLPDTSDERREAIRKELHNVQRKLEGNKSRAKKMIDRRTDEQIKVLYTDVQAACARYAKAHDVELVLHYNDTTEGDLYSPLNIARKMRCDSCFPLFAAPGMDISTEVIAALNDSLRQQGSD